MIDIGIRTHAKSVITQRTEDISGSVYTEVDESPP